MGVGRETLSTRADGLDGDAVHAKRKRSNLASSSALTSGRVLEARARTLTIGTPVRALASPRILRATSERFAKSIVCFEICAGSRAEHAFGYPLEFAADASAPNRFVLLANGAPLANYPVAVATSAGRMRFATDDQGRVFLNSTAQGPSMLFAAQMTAPVRADRRFQMLLTSPTVQP